MPVGTNLLTDTAIRKAAPKPKSFKLRDGKGLWLNVTPAGSKIWLYRYKWNDAETTLTFGHYPSMGLAEARGARDSARAKLREGENPHQAKRTAKAASLAAASATFESVAREWHKIKAPGWTTVHAADVIGSLEKYAFPKLGPLPVTSITPPIVLDVLRDIEARPAIETAHRVRERMSKVFVFAIASGKAENDPAAIVKNALTPIPPRNKRAAVKTIKDARAVLAAVESQAASPVTKLAHRLLALTALRPGALRRTPWTEFEAIKKSAPIWTVPAARMKLRLAQKQDEANSHIMPLPKQALPIIDALKKLTGQSKYVFPNAHKISEPMSENAIGELLERAGYKGRHVPHGWRAAFSTIMNENFPQDRAVIDLMIAHVPKEKVERAYNRAEHMPRRRKLAQAWADMLLESALPLSKIVAGPRR